MILMKQTFVRNGLVCKVLPLLTSLITSFKSEFIVNHTFNAIATNGNTFYPINLIIVRAFSKDVEPALANSVRRKSSAK